MLLHKFIGNHITQHVLKNVTLCSTMFVKGVYTSDNLYESGNLPREMSFKLSREQKWNELYDWVVFTAEVQKEIKGKSKKNIKNEENDVKVKQTIDDDEEGEEGKDKNTAIEKKNEKINLGEKAERIEFRPATSDKVLQEKIFTEKKSLRGQSPDNKPEKKLFEKPKPDIKPDIKPNIKTEIKKEKIQDLMSPDPLMNLSHVIGFSGINPRSVKWSKLQSNFTCYSREFTSGATKFIFYPSGCTLVIMNPISRKQHFLFGHTAPINCLSVSHDGSLIVTGQCTPALALV